MNNTCVLILMSTFNGDKFLAKQIESIQAQTHQHFKLVIRDDGSKDETVSLIQHYCKMDSRIIHLQDELGNLNVAQSFSQLMQHALTHPEEFIFFCDQDDYWLPTKLSLSLSLLYEMQNKYGKHMPMLIHSDLQVVDHKLTLMHASFLKSEQLTRNISYPLKTLLVNNFVTGCTIGMNKHLLTIATPVPKNALMHDWWCALLAAAIGKIDFIKDATLLYRQHADNTIGSKTFLKKCRELLHFSAAINKRKHNLHRCFKQAHDLSLRIQSEKQAQTNLSLIEEFSNLSHQTNIKRAISAIKLQLKPASRLRMLVFWIMLLTSR